MIRTQIQLRQALYGLIFEKPYDRISVQDILDRANIGRSTFYAHFQCKDDLLMSEIPENILGFEEDSQNFVPSLVPIFIHAQENYRLFRALMGSEGIALAYKVSQQQMINSWLTHINRLRAGGVQIELPPVVIAQYLTGAFMMVFRWWLDEGMPYSPAQMDTMLRTLATKGLEEIVIDTSKK